MFAKLKTNCLDCQYLTFSFGQPSEKEHGNFHVPFVNTMEWNMEIL